MSAMTTQQPDFYHPDHVNRTRPLGRLLSFVLFLAAFLAIGYVFYFFMSRGASRFFVNQADRQFLIQEYDNSITNYTRALTFFRNDAHSWLNRGHAEYYLGRYEQALADLTQCITLKPNEAVAYALRGLSYRKLGKPDLAKADFEKAVNAEANDYAALAIRGRARALVEDYPKAIEDMSAAIKIRSDKPSYYFLRASYYLRTKQVDLGIADADKSITGEPTNFAYLRLRSQLREAKGDMQGALADMNLAIDLKADSAKLYIDRGALYERMGDTRLAVQDYKTAARLAPNLEGTNMRIAKLLRANNDLLGADARLSTVIDNNPKNVSALLQRANVRLDMGLYKQAQSDADAAAMLDPKTEHMLLCARISQASGDNATALKHLNAAMDVAPKNDLKALIKRAEVYRNLGQFDMAIADYSKALTVQPTSADVLMGRARVYKAKGDMNAALSDLREVVKTDPDRLEAQLELGAAAAKQNNWDDATKYLNKVVQIDPRNGRAFALRGRALAAQGNLVEAVVDLSKAIELRPKDISSIVLRGHVYSALNQPAKALDDFNAALKLEPSNITALVARGRLQHKEANNAGAFKDLREAVVLLGDDPATAAKRVQLLKEQAKVLQDLNKPDYSQATLNEAIALQPGQPALALQLAKSLEKQGKYAEAEALY